MGFLEVCSFFLLIFIGAPSQQTAEPKKYFIAFQYDTKTTNPLFTVSALSSFRFGTIRERGFDAESTVLTSY